MHPAQNTPKKIVAMTGTRAVGGTVREESGTATEGEGGITPLPLFAAGDAKERKSSYVETQEERTQTAPEIQQQ